MLCLIMISGFLYFPWGYWHHKQTGTDFICSEYAELQRASSSAGASQATEPFQQ